MNLRISDVRKRLADHVYNQRVVDLDKYYSHVDVNEITFDMMRETEKRQYIEIYAEWMKLWSSPAGGPGQRSKRNCKCAV